MPFWPHIIQQAISITWYQDRLGPFFSRRQPPLSNSGVLLTAPPHRPTPLSSLPSPINRRHHPPLLRPSSGRVLRLRFCNFVRCPRIFNGRSPPLPVCSWESGFRLPSGRWPASGRHVWSLGLHCVVEHFGPFLIGVLRASVGSTAIGLQLDRLVFFSRAIQFAVTKLFGTGSQV
jgi:hypothetical protein